MTNYAIEVNNLRKEFEIKKKNGFLRRNKEKEIFVAVDNISFNVAKGRNIWLFRT